MIDNVEQTQATETHSSPESSQDNSSLDQAPQTASEALAELEKMEKFKFQGQEWSPKDLEKAIMRNKDYTQKTQALAEERRQIEQQRSEAKYYENLYADLSAVKRAVDSGDSSLINEFLKTYPEKFHGYLKQVLSDTTVREAVQNRPSGPQYDVDTLSRLQKLESILHEQEVAKNEAAINATVSAMSKKYPDAIPEMAIARVYELHNSGVKVTEKEWEKAFQQVDEQIKGVVKARYGDLVKKQSDANKKARDVESGGGTLGRAPEKFKSLKDVTNFAIQDLSRKP